MSKSIDVPRIAVSHIPIKPIDVPRTAISYGVQYKASNLARDFFFFFWAIYRLYTHTFYFFEKKKISDFKHVS